MLGIKEEVTDDEIEEKTKFLTLLRMTHESFSRLFAALNTPRLRLLPPKLLLLTADRGSTGNGRTLHVADILKTSSFWGTPPA